MSVGVSVGRGLGGESVAVNGSLLPATLQVGAIRAYQFNDMDAGIETVSWSGGCFFVQQALWPVVPKNSRCFALPVTSGVDSVSRMYAGRL